MYSVEVFSNSERIRYLKLDKDSRGRRCKGTNCKGQPCGSRPTLGSRYCFFHDPQKKKDRAAAQSRGGRNAQARLQTACPELPDVTLKSAHDVLDLVSETISMLRRGEMDRSVCSTIGYLCQVVLKSIEQGLIDDRVSKIEETLKMEKV